MEKFLNFSFIGKAPEETIQRKREWHEKLLTKDHRLNLSEEKKKRLEEIEISKSPEEIRLFGFANTWSRGRQEICGVQPHDFPIRNIFLTTSEGYKEIAPYSQSRASADVGAQRVVAVTDSNKYDLTSVIFHEITHCKGKIVVEIGEYDGKEYENLLRTGISVQTTAKQNRDGNAHEHFRGLEEAVVSQEQVHFGFDLLNRPELLLWKEKMNSEYGRTERKKIVESRSFHEDDLAWFDPENGLYGTVGYPGQRKVLRYLCQEIAATTRTTDNEVYFQFLKSHFTGHLLEIARIVEKTFGEGSFRRLGDMGTNDNSAMQTLEALRKMRLEMLKASGE